MTADNRAQMTAAIRGNQRSDRRQSASHGQSALEYATAVAVISAALLGMAVYLKRSISGGLRQGANSVGEQYHPKETKSDMTLTVQGTTVMTSKLQHNVSLGNGQTGDVMEYKTEIQGETSNKTGTEDVGPIDSNVWN